MDVRLPDGTVIQNVPEGTTKAQLAAKLKINGMTVPSEWMTAAPQKEPSMLDSALGVAGDVAAGAVRGAGSIGATILAIPDAITRKLNDGKPVELPIPGTGISVPILGNERRQAMDEGLRSRGFDPESLAFKTGKLGAEIAGTAPIGGVIAKGATKALPFLPDAIAQSPAAAKIIESISSAGFKTGAPAATNFAGKAADMGIRMIGGGVNGAATAGLINPEDAKAGAVIGAVAPPVISGIGEVGNAIGRKISGQAMPQGVIDAANAARAEGYVIPPTQVKPSLANRLLEGFSGKITTAQNASAKNQEVTNRLAAEALGLNPAQQITPGALDQLRKNAGSAYEAVKQQGQFSVDPEYLQAVTDIGAKNQLINSTFHGIRGGGMHGDPVEGLIHSLTPQGNTLDSQAVVEAIKQLRFQAKGNLKNFQDPVKADLGKAQKTAADALEGLVERNLSASGSADLLSKFREARQLIAKSHAVEDALNETTGNVAALQLAKQLEKGAPMSAELRQIAEFGRAFPKAAQSVEKMGSLPQVSPLDFGALGTMSAATSNPLLMLGVLARPAARAAVLSGPVQNGLTKQATGNAFLKALSGPDAEQLLYRSAPVLGASRF